MVTYWFHIYTGVLSTTRTGAPVARVSAKAGTDLVREIFFHDGGAEALALPGGSAGQIVAKALDAETGLPIGPLRSWDVEWEAPTQQGRGYIFRLPLYGSALEAEPAPTPNERGNIVLAAELQLVTGDGHRAKSQTFSLDIQPAVWEDEDELPEDPAPPFPLPSEIVRTTAQSLTSETQAQVRTNLGAMAASLKGAVNGVAELDSAGRVPQAQIPQTCFLRSPDNSLWQITITNSGQLQQTKL